MKTYTIKKGSPTWLTRDPTGQKGYNHFTTEKTITFTDDDLAEEDWMITWAKHLIWLYFYLPKNDRGYAVLAVQRQDVVVKTK